MGFEVGRADPGTAPDQRAFPDLGGEMRSTRGSRPDRVCIRVSKQTRWMRCRDSTHQARRTTCRRVRRDHDSRDQWPG